MKVIVYDAPLDLAERATRWLLARPDQKDAIIAYERTEVLGAGEIAQIETHIYVKRNKASITVRLCK